MDTYNIGPNKGLANAASMLGGASNFMTAYTNMQNMKQQQDIQRQRMQSENQLRALQMQKLQNEGQDVMVDMNVLGKFKELEQAGHGDMIPDSVKKDVWSSAIDKAKTPGGAMAFNRSIDHFLNTQRAPSPDSAPGVPSDQYQQPQQQAMKPVTIAGQNYAPTGNPGEYRSEDGRLFQRQNKATYDLNSKYVNNQMQYNSRMGLAQVNNAARNEMNQNTVEGRKYAADVYAGAKVKAAGIQAGADAGNKSDIKTVNQQIVDLNRARSKLYIPNPMTGISLDKTTVKEREADFDRQLEKLYSQRFNLSPGGSAPVGAAPGKAPAGPPAPKAYDWADRAGAKIGDQILAPNGDRLIKVEGGYDPAPTPAPGR